ncbi:hypothetical protein [Actinopolymorpha alba]|uniref:hypothetical protein n=1 Tax=Actinopolymorpha alba TaxID=533267 RepID=UPI00037B7248|nr:hypothetical protein [Actinopolymorpha alba]
MTSTASRRGIPAHLSGLVDDAAMFPPSSTPLDEALAAHVEHQSGWYADLVGPFLCPDLKLPDLAGALGSLAGHSPDATPLPVGLIVTGGAGAIGPALTWAGRDERIRLAGVEIALRDEPDLARNVARIALAFDAAGLDEDVPAAIEIPRTEGWQGALDALAETGHRAKLRTGGVSADAFPTEREVAAFILACLDREVAFKCTAGLHHAVRTTAPGDGPGGSTTADQPLEQHGFLNILLATRRALDGAGAGALVQVLAERDTAAVSDQVRACGPAGLASSRRWFTSFGSCSVSLPLDGLLRLGFLQD